jgi:hypothetical protein
MVAFERPLDYFNEVFQFDLLHTCRDPDSRVQGDSCVLENSCIERTWTVSSRICPKSCARSFKEATQDRQISDISSYSLLIHYLSHMDRAHVLSLDREGEFFLSGITPRCPRTWTRN